MTIRNILIIILLFSFAGVFGQKQSIFTIKERKSADVAIYYSKKARQERNSGHYIAAFGNYLTALKSLAANHNNSYDYVNFSYETHKEALLLADTMMKEYMNIGSKIVLLRTLSIYYERAISLAYILYSRNKTDNWVDEAFMLSEKNRNLMLIESVKSYSKFNNQKIVTAIIDEQRKNTAQIIIIRNILDTEREQTTPDIAKLKIYSDSLIQLQSRADSLNYYIKNNYPEYSWLYNKTHYATPDIIIPHLKKNNRCLIEYFCGDSSVYIFILTPNGRYFEKVKNDNIFKAAISGFQNGIIYFRQKQYSENAFILYTYLLSPVEKHLSDWSNLIIIPDKTISCLPFECFIQTKPSNNESYVEYDYLIRHYCISYAYSATLLIQNCLRDSKKTEGDILYVAPGFSDKIKEQHKNCHNYFDKQYLLLAEQANSIEFAEKLQDKYEVKCMLHDKATVSNFKEESGKYKIIHIASHSVFNLSDTSNARIYFAQGNCNSNDSSYFISQRDIYNMRFNSELTILGSCRTGFGKFRKSEGIISLAHAFTYAGSKALLYSLWEVDEKQTYILMNYFYTELYNGGEKDIALMNAKLKYLEQSNEITANPYYWAGFILNGDNKAVINIKEKQQSNTQWFIVIIIIAILVLSGAIIWQIKN